MEKQEQSSKLKLNAKNGSITFALFMVGYIFISLLGQLIVGEIFGKHRSVYKVICSTFSSVSILAVILFYVFYGKHKVTEITCTNNSGGIYLLIAFLLSCGMFLGLGFVNESIATLVKAWGLNSGGIQLNMASAWHFIAYTLTFALFPAILEEVLFRGILLNCFARMKRVVAVLISALLFALYHQSIVQFLYQFIYGVALGFLAITAKSIFPCMIAHFLNNFAVLLFGFLRVSVDLYSPLFIVIGANALAFFGAIIFFAQRKRRENETVKGEVKEFFIPFGILGLFTCLAVLIGNLVG